MRLFLMALALAFAPVALAAQQVDTVQVDVAPDLERVVVRGPLNLSVGDTATYHFYGLSSSGDTVDISGVLVSLNEQVLIVVPGGSPDATQVAAVGAGSARLTVGNIQVVTADPVATQVDSVRAAWLDPVDGRWVWASEGIPHQYQGATYMGPDTVPALAEVIQLCGVEYYPDGTLGVGGQNLTTGQTCIAAYNSMVGLHRALGDTRWAFASKRATFAISHTGG